MKKILVLLVLFVCTMVLSSTAYSLPISGQDVKLSWSGTYGGAHGGGEFLIDVYNNGGGTPIDQYISFCVEYSEHIGLKTRYNIANVSDFAEEGSGGAVDGKDELSDRTKWLFWNYLYGSNTNLMRKDEDRANAVQLVIWDYEEEINHTDNPSKLLSYSAWTDEADTIKNFVDTTFSNADDTSDLMASIGNVKVLNLEDNDGRYKQSQIVAAPVPEPATMLLFGTGLVGLAGVARRKKK